VVAGVAGLMAGAVSMAAGEYVSVSSQADSERAELDRERQELVDDPAFEHAELAAIYVKRGLNPALADQVATRLTEVDALGAHAHDELGLSATFSARPVQAALASAASFAVGAMLPLAVAATVPADRAEILIAVTSLVLLCGLGALAAKVGGAPAGRAAWRVTFWGALAMGLTALVGWAFGMAV
jgi:VIT1/CCC1 family predicted Fe2+/Mn2+ transporter